MTHAQESPRSNRGGAIMVRKEFILIMFILVIASVSAYYGGDIAYFDFSDYDNIENITYEYFGGDYNYDGLIMIIGEDNARLQIPINYHPDNFLVVFTLTQRVEIEEPECDSCSSGSSGGSVTKSKTITKTVYEDEPCEIVWECGDWSECFNETQNRTCEKVTNECNSSININSPEETQVCEVIEEEAVDEVGEVNEVIAKKGLHWIFKLFIGLLITLFIFSVIFVYWKDITKLFKKS